MSRYNRRLEWRYRMTPLFGTTREEPLFQWVWMFAPPKAANYFFVTRKYIIDRRARQWKVRNRAKARFAVPVKGFMK